MSHRARTPFITSQMIEKLIVSCGYNRNVYKEAIDSPKSMGILSQTLHKNCQNWK